MADLTVRQKIIETLQDRLKVYDWQVFDPVIWVGRSIFDSETEQLPVVTILPRPEESEGTRYGTNYIAMPIDMSALISLQDGQQASAIGESVFGELHSAAFSGDGTIIPVNDDNFSLTYSGGGIVEYPDELGPAVITIGLTLHVTYETYTGDPYN